VAAGHPLDAFDRIDAAGGLVTPGLIDAHTHLVFAGTREAEWQMRARGAGYLEVLAAGGGILSTVAATRAASDEELLAGARRRLARCSPAAPPPPRPSPATGWTWRRSCASWMSSAAGRRGADPARAHVPGRARRPAEYRDRPGGRRRPDATYAHGSSSATSCRRWPAGIARFCDVFCEDGVFSRSRAAASCAPPPTGLALRLHADELAPSGGAELAAELGCVSADHLAAPSECGIARWPGRRGGHPVVATLLPATSWFLGKHHFAPARRFIERAIPVALATDLNPGTSPTVSLPLVMSIACVEMGLTPAEALVAVTINAAHSLGLMGAEIGSIEPGKQADLVVWDVPSSSSCPTGSARASPERSSSAVRAGLIDGGNCYCGKIWPPDG
jgi:imidazolonepropionase